MSDPVSSEEEKCSVYWWNQIVLKPLTHWGQETHICFGKLIIIGSDNGLSPGRRQAIIWTNAGILLIGPLGTNFNEILIEIDTFSFKKMHLKMSSAKGRPFSLGLNELIVLDKWINTSHGETGTFCWCLHFCDYRCKVDSLIIFFFCFMRENICATRHPDMRKLPRLPTCIVLTCTIGGYLYLYLLLYLWELWCTT